MPTAMLDLPTSHSLWVVEYGEPRTNDLYVLLIEAITSTATIPTEYFGDTHPIAPTEASRVFRVLWSDYVAFAVRNERFATVEKSGAVGSGLGRRTEGAFFDYVKVSTFADDLFPGPLAHWFLNTEWHCFDVVTANDPEVSQLSQLEADAVIARFL